MIQENKSYLFSMPEINLWGHILKREDMSLIFYDMEDIEALHNIFKDISNPNLEKLYIDYSNDYVTKCMKLYNLGYVCRNYDDYKSVIKSISDKWEMAADYFDSIKETDYIKFIDYCTSFLKHDLHTFLFFLPNYKISEFSSNKDIELYYHWRLAINK